MTNSHVISALRLKRAEISGHIHGLEKRIARQWANLANLDATIKLFSPGANPDAIPPKRAYRRTRSLLVMSCPGLPKTPCGPHQAAHVGRNSCRRHAGEGNACRRYGVPGTRCGEALTVLRRLAKRGVAVKFGSGRNAQWAPNKLIVDNCLRSCNSNNVVIY